MVLRLRKNESKHKHPFEDEVKIHFIHYRVQAIEKLGYKKKRIKYKLQRLPGSKLSRRIEGGLSYRIEDDLGLGSRCW